MALANTRDIEQYTDSLARYMPGGDLFASRSVADSTFRKLLRGLSGELFRCNGLIKEYCEQIIPDTTTKFVSEWESALGIPDDCFFGTGTLEERRLHVLIKLASFGVQTQQDFINLALLFGIVVTVTNGTLHGTFPMEFPLSFFNSSQDARFTIIVDFDEILGGVFPYTFPILFGDATLSIIECLFEKLKPANTELIFGLPVTFTPLDIPNLVLWLDVDDAGTIIELGGNISQWSDKSGNGNHLKQDVGGDQPTLDLDGSILFDGISQFLKADPFTLVQPETIYILFQQVSFDDLDTIYDGQTGDSGVLRQQGSSPEITFFAGGFIGTLTTLPLGVYGVITTVVNGASSVLQLNNETPLTGNSGTRDMNGFSLARRTTLTRFGHIKVKEIVVYAVAHDASERATVINYLSEKI